MKRQSETEMVIQVILVVMVVVVTHVHVQLHEQLINDHQLHQHDLKMVDLFHMVRLNTMMMMTMLHHQRHHLHPSMTMRRAWYHQQQ